MLHDKKNNSVLFDGRFLIENRFGISRDSLACFKLLNEIGAIGGVLGYKFQPVLPDGFDPNKVTLLKNSREQFVLKSLVLTNEFNRKSFKTRIFFQSQIDSAQFEFQNSHHRIVRVHDLFPISHPEWFKKSTTFLFQKGIRNIKKGSTILVNSKFTLKAFQELVDWEEKKLRILVVPCDTTRPISKRCNFCMFCIYPQLIDKPYLLSVGTIEPRKNYINLVQAWKATKDKSPYQQLIIVGKIGWKSQESLRLISSEASVVHLKDCCDAGLDELYRNASAFITASLSEGYNIPLDEAANYGCKLIISDTDVHHERYDSSEGLWFNPESIDNLATAILGDTDQIKRSKKANTDFKEVFLATFQDVAKDIL
jgi:glycosyltransferase involved in cell wall biosynthesis